MELGVEAHVNWCGQVTGSDKVELLSRAELMVLLSYSENFANTVPECLALGVPVVVSKDVGMSSYVADTNLGVVVDIANDNVSAVLNAFYEDATARREIKQRAPAKVRHDFSSEVLIPQYLNEYATRQSKMKEEMT